MIGKVWEWTIDWYARHETVRIAAARSTARAAAARKRASTPR
jgi:formylglycine-generating enzyme required for sulfatase activity